MSKTHIIHAVFSLGIFLMFLGEATQKQDMNVLLEKQNKELDKHQEIMVKTSLGDFKNKNELLARQNKSFPHLLELIIELRDSYTLSKNLKQKIAFTLDKKSYLDKPTLKKRQKQIDDFVNGEMLLVEELVFISSELAFAIYENTGCYGPPSPSVMSYPNSLNLIEDTLYEFPILVHSGRGYIYHPVIYNSLQGDHPDYVQFKTPKADGEIHTLYYDCIIFNEFIDTVQKFENRAIKFKVFPKSETDDSIESLP